MSFVSLLEDLHAFGPIVGRTACKRPPTALKTLPLLNFGKPWGDGIQRSDPNVCCQTTACQNQFSLMRSKCTSGQAMFNEMALRVEGDFGQL